MAVATECYTDVNSCSYVIDIIVIHSFITQL